MRWVWRMERVDVEDPSPARRACAVWLIWFGAAGVVTGDGMAWDERGWGVLLH